MSVSYQRIIVLGIIVLALAFILWFWGFPLISDYLANLAEAQIIATPQHISQKVYWQLIFALHLNPSNPVPYYWFGFLNLQKNDFRSAVITFQQSLLKNLELKRPDLHKDALFFLGHTLNRLGQPDKAALVYKEYLEKYGQGKPVYTYHRLAFIYFERLNKPQEALRLLEKFQSFNPVLEDLISETQIASYYHLLGRVYYYFDRNKEALDMANKALEYFKGNLKNLDPGFYQRVKTMKAVYLQALGKFADSKKEFEEADKIIWGNTTARCPMAYFITARYEKKYKKAIEMLEPFVKGKSRGELISSNALPCVLNLSEVYAEQKDRANAEKYYDLLKKTWSNFESALMIRSLGKLERAIWVYSLD